MGLADEAGAERELEAVEGGDAIMGVVDREELFCDGVVVGGEGF